MLDYNKMDEVLNNLDSCADTLKSVSDIQMLMENNFSKVNDIIEKLNSEAELVRNFIAEVKQIENKYSNIDDKIDSVLQDYKKVHSSFEYIDLEIKKNAMLFNNIKDEISVKIDEIISKQNDLIDNLNLLKKSISKNFESTLEKFNKSERFHEEANKSNKFIKKCVIATLIVSVVACILSIVAIIV